MGQNFNAITFEQEMSQMSFLEQAKLFGYPALKSHTVTEDGYILELHRLPGPGNETVE